MYLNKTTACQCKNKTHLESKRERNSKISTEYSLVLAKVTKFIQFLSCGFVEIQAGLLREKDAMFSNIFTW